MVLRRARVAPLEEVEAAEIELAQDFNHLERLGSES
jgi:hypothetical protein